MFRRANIGLIVVTTVVFVVSSSVIGAEINFDDQPFGAIIHDQYKSDGVIFSSVDFDFGSYTVTPVFDGVINYGHWPTSAPRSIEPTRDGTFRLAPFPNFPALQMEFVIPGTDIPAVTDFVSISLDGATNEGEYNKVTMFGFDLYGNLLASSSGDDRIPNLVLSLAIEGIQKIIVALEQGSRFDIETYDNVSFNTPTAPAALETLEVVGPNEVAENFQAQYQAIAHYDNNSTRDVTDSVDCVWSVEPNDIANINDGLLETQMIDYPQNTIISAEYTEGNVNESAQKQVSVLTICPHGSALELDGQNDYVVVPNDDSLNTTDELTIQAWVYYRDTYRGEILVKARGYEFGIMDGRLQPSIYANNRWYQPKDTRILDIDTWYNVTMTYDGSEVMCYINGDGQKVRNLTGLIGPYTTHSARIGAWYGSEFLNGFLDEVAIYNRALFAEEIWASMHTRLIGNEPNLVGYWDFDEGEGQVTNDLSDSNNHGQLGSTPEVDNSDPNWVYSDAPVGICHPPVAEAGPNQVAVEGDSVILDGSGSFDADEDILAYSWRLIFKPSGSIAELTDPNSEQTTFIPDVPGEYTAGLVVSDDYFDSEEDEVNITVISLVDAAVQALSEAAEDIGNLTPNTLKNSNMANALTNKIDAVLEMIDGGNYEGALHKLENDILKKTDGCANGGEPDKNDWIRSCEEQEQIYPLVIETIEYVRSLME